MKEQLTEQSVKLFEQKGFSATSIQDIVDALDVTKGTFYYYFTSKETLLMDIHLHYIENLLHRQKLIFDGKENYRAKLVKNVELLIYDIETQGANGRVYFREMRHLKEENADKIKAKREEFRLTIEEILVEGIKAGEFRDSLHPKMITFAVLGVTNWAYEWFNPSGKVSTEKLADMYIDFILHGVF